MLNCRSDSTSMREPMSTFSATSCRARSSCGHWVNKLYTNKRGGGVFFGGGGGRRKQTNRAKGWLRREDSTSRLIFIFKAYFPRRRSSERRSESFGLCRSEQRLSNEDNKNHDLYNHNITTQRRVTESTYKSRLRGAHLTVATIVNGLYQPIGQVLLFRL